MIDRIEASSQQRSTMQRTVFRPFRRYDYNIMAFSTLQERQEASRQEREEKRSRLAAAMQGGPAIAIDLDFDTYMNEGEHR